jgi:hypothetical protein
MRRLLPILVMIALVAGAAVALAQIESSPPAHAATIAASGAFEISDSKEGEPIFAATGIAPGDSTSGTVTIEDPGSEPVKLSLRRGELVDEPGLGSGLLSSRLHLTVVDVTDPGAPRTVYSGPLDSMPDQAAGRLEPGATRTFEFTATLPDSGDPAVDNEIQGASTTVAYSWVAEEAGEGEPGEEEGGEEPGEGEEGPAEETPGSGGGGGESPGGPDYNPGGTGPGGGVSPASAKLDLTVPKVKSRLRRGRLVVWTHCDETCRVTVRGRISASNGLGRRRVAKIRFTAKNFYAAGGKRLRIRIPRGMRHWLKVTPGHKRVRIKIRVTAVGTDGQRDIVKKTIRLRPRHR